MNPNFDCGKCGKKWVAGAPGNWSWAVVALRIPTSPLESSTLTESLCPVCARRTWRWLSKGKQRNG